MHLCAESRIVDDQGRHDVRDRGRMRGDGQCQRRTGIGEHVLDAIGRIVRIHRYERGTGLGDRPHRRHRLDGAGHRQRHHRFRADTPGDEQPGQPIRVLVEGAVTQLSALVRQRRPSGVGVRGRGEDLGERARLRAVAAPHPGQLSALLLGEQIDVGDDRRRILEHRVEHAQEPRRQRLDGLRIEHVGRERERRVHTVRDCVPGSVAGEAFLHRQPQIEGGDVRSGVDAAHHQAVLVEMRGAAVVELEHHLEQRRVRVLPRPVQRLDQLRERCLGVPECSGVGAAHVGEQVVERQARRQPGPQREGVDELSCRAAARHRRADRDVVDVGQACQQHHQRRMDGGEHRAAPGLGLRDDGPVHRRGDLEVHPVAGEGAPCRAGPVRRQRQDVGQAGQLPRPELELRRGAQQLGAHHRTLGVDVGDPGVGGGLHELLHQFEEPAVVGVQRFLRVASGIRPELHECSCRTAALEEVDEQVLDRAGGDDVVFALDVAEGHLLVEEHDVDHRSGQPAGGPGETGIPADVLDAAPLMPQGAHQFQLDPAHEVGDGVVGQDRRTQRCHVDEHAAGPLQRRRGAGRDGHVDQHVGASGHAGEVAREGRDQHGGRRGLECPIGGVECGDDGLGQRCALEPAHRGDRCVRLGQRGPGLDSGDVVGPVLTIGLEATGRAILLVDREELAQIERPVRFRIPVLERGGVERGDPVRYRHTAVPVEGDVMNPRVPQVLSITDLQDGHVDDAIAGEIDRDRVVVFHPGVRGGRRIRVIA